MPLNSPLANLYESLLARIKTTVPGIRYISHELGQLEEPRPPVSWPCALIDFDEIEYSDQGNAPRQQAGGRVVIRLGLQAWSGLSSQKPEHVRAKGLEFLELEHQVAAALHYWAAPGFNRLLRRGAATEKRDDDVRVRVLTFEISYTDEAALPTYTLRPRPTPVIVPPPVPDAPEPEPEP